MKSSDNLMKQVMFEAYIKDEYPILMQKLLAELTGVIEREKEYLKDIPEETLFAGLVTSIGYLFTASMQSNHESEESAIQELKEVSHLAGKRIEQYLPLDYSTIKSEEDMKSAILAHIRILETHFINQLANKED